jgi:uncharacterized membrane protein
MMKDRDFSYNYMSGKNHERLGALSDGIFAFAMTLLVLDIHAPLSKAIHSEQDFLLALTHLAPRVVPWLMSYLTLGIFWVGQQSQLNHLKSANRRLTWLHFLFLAFVTAVPFTTALLATFITYRGALVIYWLNIFSLGMSLIATWKYSRSSGLLDEQVSEHLYVAVLKGLWIAQVLFAAGAAVCIVSTYWSIACLMAVQSYYIFGRTLSWPHAAGVRCDKAA